VLSIDQINEVNKIKSFASLFLLLIMFFSAAILADLIKNLSELDLYNLIKLTFNVLLLLGFLGYSRFFQFYSSSYLKSVFPFTEPSFFALFITPFLIFFCTFENDRRKFFFFAAALIEALLLENLTMLIGCFLASLIFLRLRNFLFVAISIFIFAVVSNFEYFLDRLMFFSENNQNISALVYTQGWQMSMAAWKQSWGFGLGFQQMGLNGSNVDATSKLMNLYGLELNIFDGGFTFSKILSEFGIFGLCLMGFYIFAAFNSFFILRRYSENSNSLGVHKVFAASVLLAFSLEFFIRGAGYFTPTILIFISALYLNFSN
jgi:hypothetical protein